MSRTGSVSSRFGAAPIGIWPRLAVGVAAGFVGGLLGGGGGVVTIPALDRLIGWPRVVCLGTSTIVTSFVGVAGIAAYLLLGAGLAINTAAGMITGGVLGAQIGPRLARRASERWLRLLFIVILVAAAIDLVYPVVFADRTNDLVQWAGSLRDAPIDAFMAAVAVGLVVGCWSSAMGLGGGLLAVPALVLLFGDDPHLAEATSLLVMLPNALSGAIAHARQGTADVSVGIVTGVGALPGSLAGVSLACALTTDRLRLVFAAFMGIIVVREILGYRRRYCRQ